MKKKFSKLIPAILLILGMAGILTHYFLVSNFYNNVRIISMTAISQQGIWTEENVGELNFWNSDYKKAIVLLRPNEQVVFKFSSKDSTHIFYVPELNIGPIEVNRNQTVEVPYTATKNGTFAYLSTTIWGELYMHGNIIVDDDDIEIQLALNKLDGNSSKITEAQLETIKVFAFIKLGESTFRKKGCFNCHGESGKGGVINPNYIKKHIPKLNILANTLKIDWEEDGDMVIKLLEEGENLESLEANPPFENYLRFLAQYNSIKTKIKHGAYDLQKADSAGISPPLFMPAWAQHLTDNEIDAIIAYLIKQNRWE